MLIFVKTITGKTISLKVQSHDSIETVRQMLEDKEGCVISDQQRFIFRGMELKEGHTLAEYYVQNESILQLVLRIRESPESESSSLHTL